MLYYLVALKLHNWRDPQLSRFFIGTYGSDWRKSAPQHPIRERDTEEDDWPQGKEQRWFRDSGGVGSHGVSEGEWAGRCAESRGTENTAALGPGHLIC